MVFGIRPEDVLFVRPGQNRRSKENTLETIIVSVLPQGFMYRLLLQVTDDFCGLEALLTRQVVEKRNLKVGDRYRFFLPRAAIHLIPA